MTLNARLLLVVGCLVAAGCSRETATPNPDILVGQRAIDEIKGALSDPDSATFENVNVRPNGTVCGRVNAKNRMGGYNGFVRFVYSPDVGVNIETNNPAPTEYYELSKYLQNQTNFKKLELECYGLPYTNLEVQGSKIIGATRIEAAPPSS